MVAGLHKQTDTTDRQGEQSARPLRSAEAPWLTDDLVRSRHDLGRCTDRQAGTAARLRRYRDHDLPTVEGAVRHGAQTGHKARRELAAPDRPGLGGARLQHAQPSRDAAEGQLSLSSSREPDEELRMPINGTRIKIESEGNARKHSGTKRCASRMIPLGVGPWISGPPSLPPATWAMPPCRPSRWTRFCPTGRTPTKPLRVLSTPASAMTPSPTEARPRSYRRMRTLSYGRPTVRGSRPQLGPTRIEVPQPDHLATLEPIPRPKPRRDPDSLCHVAVSTLGRTGLRPPGQPTSRSGPPS